MEDTRKLLDLPFPQLLRWRVKETGDKVALREKDFGYWNNYTWNDYYDYVEKSPWGLRRSGCKEEVAILIGDNIPEMLFVALGAQSIGAISAAIYQTTMPEEIAQLLDYIKATDGLLRRPGAGGQDRRDP
jgi:long-chain acyl-CoA synthetase